MYEEADNNIKSYGKYDLPILIINKFIFPIGKTTGI